ncbi:MAG: hypothetical protein WDO73_36100 [Ignavibacteriota bacterium]
MAFVDLTKQLAQQAIQSAMSDPPPAAPSPDNPGASILHQIGAMQRVLKEDEELIIHLQHGDEKIRVMEIFLPSPQVAVLTGVDANRVMTRVISAVAALQLVVRTGKAPAGAKAVRVGLVVPKGK